MWRTSLYLAASASAEFFADIALCPMEAVKVRIQTMPGFAGTLREGFPKIWKNEGFNGYDLHSVLRLTNILNLLSEFCKTFYEHFVFLKL